MTMGPVGRAYAALVAAGELKPDADQSKAVQALDRFAADAAGKKSSFFSRLFGKAEHHCGIYLWGGVGRGKSMLMDLAFDNIDVRPKRRTHFHAFMLEVHERLREARKSDEGDPVIRVAEQIADEVKFLAFDEMMVTNAADAMIMSRLFTAMIGEGVAIVTTSNRPPRDLYKDGLNRELFMPFIELIEQKMEVLPLNGPVDYRLDRMRGLETWLVPNGAEATAKLSAAFFRLTDHPVEDRAAVPSEELDVGGRLLVQAAVRRAAGRGRLSRDRAAVPHGDHRRNPDNDARDA
jgi:cell division protein ZapE